MSTTSASTKKALKSIKNDIEAGDYQSATHQATELLKSLNDKDPDAATVLAFRALALTHLEKKEEAEKCYIHAHKLQPDSKLANHGLRRLYEKEEQWDRLARLYQVLVQEAYDAGDGEKCAEALQDLVQLQSKRGLENELYQTLRLLLPSSSLIPLLQPLNPPANSFTPFPTPTYPPISLTDLPKLPKSLPHILHLLSSLPLLLHLLVRCQVLIHEDIESKVKAGRTRLGAGPEKEVRKNVEADVLGGVQGSEMVELLREVGGHSGAEESVRRYVEIKEFDYWRKLVGCLKPEEAKSADKKSSKGNSKAAPVKEETGSFLLPALFSPQTATRPTKSEALSRADGLAKGFVLLGVADPGAEEGWLWVIEGADEPSIHYDIEKLHNLAKTFPETHFADFIDDYCRWFHLPLPQPDEDETKSPPAITAEAVKKKGSRKVKTINAKERRKARRIAEREGVLSENVDQEERDELVGTMTKLLDKLPRSIFAHRVMTQISSQEEDWANAIQYAEKARNLVKELEAERGIELPQVKLSLDAALGIALVPYYPPKHHTRASRLLKGVLGTQPDNVEARFARAQIYQVSGNWQEARKQFNTILDTLKDRDKSDKMVVAAREEVAWCFVNEGKLDAGREILEEVVELRDSRWQQNGKEDEAFLRARAWWRLGRTEWVIGDDESKAHAEEWFTASIRALSTFASAYTSLGICYLENTPPDNDRALKCFQKAFELDATETEAAQRLANGYADDDEWALVRIVANRVMEGEGGVEGVAGGDVMNLKGRLAPKNGWAWKALGSTEMHYKNYAKAAQAYQVALRADPEDVTTWVQLGESYVRCGRHMAGLKALNHALDLDPTNWMAMYDIGEIHYQLASYDIAMESFDKVVELAKDQVGVLGKMAETMLSLGRSSVAAGFRERARKAFHRATTLAGEVLKFNQGHRPWAWKVIGDATFELGQQEHTAQDNQSSIDVLRPILELLVEDDTDKRATTAGLKTPSQFLQDSNSIEATFTLRFCCAAFAYRAWLLKNEPRVVNSSLYDLACALHLLSGKLESEEKMAAMKSAVGNIKLALDKDAGDERLWNALAVICADGGEEVAQHAFVVSLELYAKDPIVWTNLGYLYLRLNDLELANQCFLKSQIIDPDHAPAWLGQGLIAEKQGEMDHARGLYAHAVTLSAGSLLEADLALASTKFSDLLSGSTNVNISQLHAPAFALRHYIHQRPHDADAVHLYALISERLGLVDEAADYLKTAAELFEHQFEESESPEIEGKYTIALVNLGRVNLAKKDYEAALESFTNAWELVSSHPTDSLDATGLNTVVKMKVQCQLGQGLAHAHLGQNDEAVGFLESALQEAESASKDSTKIKDKLTVVLARILWNIGSDDAKETAKSHLMECLSHETPSIKVITTLAAIAMITSDEDLLEASISELHSLSLERRMQEDTQDQVSLLLSANSLTNDDIDGAMGILDQSLHMKPIAEAKLRLGQLLIQSGRYEQAIQVLSMSVAGLALEDDAEEISAIHKLKGIAMILRGENGPSEELDFNDLNDQDFEDAGNTPETKKVNSGLSEIKKAVKICPWNDENRDVLAWAVTSQSG